MANIIISKIESKSQQHHHQLPHSTSLWKYHYFKDPSKSQLPGLSDLGLISCGKISLFQRSKANHSQIVVINWKNNQLLWQISLFQRSKANHTLTICVYINCLWSCGKISLFHRLKVQGSLVCSCSLLWQYQLFQRSKANHKLPNFKHSHKIWLWQISLFPKIESKITAKLN